VHNGNPGRRAAARLRVRDSLIPRILGVHRQRVEFAHGLALLLLYERRTDSVSFLTGEMPRIALFFLAGIRAPGRGREIQSRAVHAIALATGLRAIGKYVTEMAAAP